jgi:diacylglycerol O-acyltransferase
MLKHVDFVASDVVGFDVPVHLAGAPVGGLVVFGPTLGTSLNLTLLTYDGTCSVGVTMDRAAIPRSAMMADCLKEGFEEVLTLAGKHNPVELPLHERSRRPVAKPVHSPNQIGHP